MTDLFDEALKFAAKKHGGQRRKGSDLPYILHPMEAATIVATMSEDRELLAAALLHDTVEDTDTTIDEIRAAFGDRVAMLVASETEDKQEGIPRAASWEDRKLNSLRALRDAEDPAIRMLWLGDKLSNIRSFYRQYLTEGAGLWQHYHQKDPGKQEWYYRTIAGYLSELKNFPAYREYMSLIDLVFGEE